MSEQRTEGQHDVPKVDLNTATVEELTQLLRIGLKIAGRIIEYRETVRPFEKKEDLMAVPGIGRETYRRLANRLTVSQAAQPPEEESKPRPTVDKVEEERLSAGEEPSSSIEPEPLVEEARAKLEEPPPRELPPPRQAPPEVRPPAGASPPVSSAWRGGFTWLAAASLIGAVMGAILALLIIGGINGTLDLNQRMAVAELGAEADRLSRQAGALQTDLDGLRGRLDALEGLTGRLDNAERDIEELDSGLAGAQTDIATLNTRADALGEDIATVRAAADRFNAFLDGLRDLLFEFQGAPPTPTPAVTPMATPQPSRTPRVTPTPSK
jgi:competence ComEA-like helix-hairpin-helix protein